MTKRFSIEWYDTVTEWVHDTHKKVALSRTDLIKNVQTILKDCENPVIAIKVWK